MPSVFQKAGTATLTIDGSDYSCQLVSFSPGWRDDTPDRAGGELTACGDTIPAEGTEDYPARPVLGIVHDWGSSGISTALSAAHGQTVPLVVKLDTDQAGIDRTYSGDVIVPRVPDEWKAGQLQRTDALTFAAVSFTGPTPTP